MKLSLKEVLVLDNPFNQGIGERIVRSFEDKENAINRSNVRKNREAKGLIEKKRSCWRCYKDELEQGKIF